ncbi:hypothetical protein M011DRAFT_115184 [Sporormia fimetaria CBS 119925]|uniref:Uncharacterized protein n=1 Tax=Sporormia fimetaria CBS 119925 TaxID=1340428 RepID=A0A6A6VLI7_9PLEO|nr:hypothetical protein M011DRAFT_115184 [Sporormia fimetaria CBS 119925]
MLRLRTSWQRVLGGPPWYPLPISSSLTLASSGTKHLSCFPHRRSALPSLSKKCHTYCRNQRSKVKKSELLGCGLHDQWGGKFRGMGTIMFSWPSYPLLDVCSSSSFPLVFFVFVLVLIPNFPGLCALAWAGVWGSDGHRMEVFDWAPICALFLFEGMIVSGIYGVSLNACI